MIRQTHRIANSTDTQALLGIHTTHKLALQQDTLDWIQPPSECDASALFGRISYEHAQEIDVMLDKVTEPPPQIPNCYSDGSVNHPTKAMFGLPTAGIWWPRRFGVLSHNEVGY